MLRRRRFENHFALQYRCAASNFDTPSVAQAIVDSFDVPAPRKQFDSTAFQTFWRDVIFSIGALWGNRIGALFHSPGRLARRSKVATPKSFVSAAELTLQKRYAFPIRTYKAMETDPLNALTNSLSKLALDEGTAIQLLISPASEHWQAKPRHYALQIQQGRNPDVVTSSIALKIMNGFFRLVGDAFDQLFSPKTKQERPGYMDASGMYKPLQLTPMQNEMVKKFEEKASRAGFKFNLRVVTSSIDQASADTNLRNVLASFMQYTLPPFNGFKVLRKDTRRVMTDYIFRVFHNTRAILNTEELASLWHLPTRFIETPNIKWLMAKKAPAPVNVPTSGVLLGRNVYRGVETKIYIDREDRTRHQYVIGRTGTGKTELLKNMAIQDIRNGEGLCIVDPHGDFVEEVLAYIPKERADDVILFEPADMDRPLGLNMLEVKGPEQKDFAVQEMIAIFMKLFPPEMIGPMFEHNMRNVMLTLMEDKQYPGTLADIPRMFTDTDFQKYKVSKVKDPIVRSFWEKEMAKTSDFHKSEMLGYLISKVGRFVENEMMRNIIGQPQSAFDFREVMDQGKILLINLSKGKTGEVNAKLLGLIIVSKLQMAALSRADIPEEKRRDFYLYVDEFQNFTTSAFTTILSETRKYGMALTMANQFVSQLDEQIREAVFGNVGSLLTFQLGIKDAAFFKTEMYPADVEDIINLPNYHLLAKLSVQGRTTLPFPIHSLSDAHLPNLDNVEAIRAYSRSRYGRDAFIVDQEIQSRFNRSSA